MHIVKWLFVLVFSFSCTAVAQPMRVTSQLSGDFRSPNPIVLGQLGHGDFFDGTEDSLPFVLTLSAVVDPGDPATTITPGQAGTRASGVDVILTMGGETTHFRNLDAFVSLSASPSSYHMQVSFAHSFYIATFSTWLQGPAGSFDGLPLAPRQVDQTPGMTSGLDIMTYPPHPDMPGMWSMASLASAGSLSVVSAVPEPASVALLCAGLLALACGERRRTRARK